LRNQGKKIWKSEAMTKKKKVIRKLTLGFLIAQSWVLNFFEWQHWWRRAAKKEHETRAIGAWQRPFIASEPCKQTLSPVKSSIRPIKCKIIELISSFNFK